jgi:hypothetical protein
MVDYEAKLLEVLGKLVDSSSPNNLQKGQPVTVTILQTNSQDQLPSLDEACREFEKRCDISPDFFVDGRETPKSIQLKYVIPIDKLEKALTGPSRIKINGRFFRLFTRCLQTYKLNIFGFSRNALNDETKIRNACDVFGSGLRYLFIPAFVNARGQRVHYGNVVAIYSERPRVIDYLHVLNRCGLRVNIQYPNRAEAMREKMKREQKGSDTKNLKKEISQEFTIDEKRTNESSIPKGKNAEKKNAKDSQATRRNDENNEKESDFENSESDRESVKSVSTHPEKKSRKVKRRNRQKGGQDDDNNNA